MKKLINSLNLKCTSTIKLLYSQICDISGSSGYACLKYVCCKFDLMMALEKMSALLLIHLEANMNVCTRFHDSPSNFSQDISWKTTNVILMVALEETSENH